MANVYFELTEEFNREGRNVVLSSGQAVVWYRLTMMSKDGDWIVREDAAACDTVRSVLAAYSARYRAGAPLAVEWLAGGWSSHFEFTGARGYRVRCDFVSRPARVDRAAVATLFTRDARGELPVVDLPSLIAIKRTQRAKDYPVIGALARLLPPDQEIEATTDPDRVIELAPAHGTASARDVVVLARAGRPRDEIVVAMAKEIDREQQADRRRMERYRTASARYLAAFQRAGVSALPLVQAHEKAVELATALLPRRVE